MHARLAQRTAQAASKARGLFNLGRKVENDISCDCGVLAAWLNRKFGVAPVRDENFTAAAVALRPQD